MRTRGAYLTLVVAVLFAAGAVALQIRNRRASARTTVHVNADGSVEVLFPTSAEFRNLLKAAPQERSSDCFDYCVTCVDGPLHGHRETVCTCAGLFGWVCKNERAAAACGINYQAGWTIVDGRC